jgi:hypothetical protein
VTIRFLFGKADDESDKLLRQRVFERVLDIASGRLLVYELRHLQMGAHDKESSAKFFAHMLELKYEGATVILRLSESTKRLRWILTTGTTSRCTTTPSM